jgi:hypothetical protein
LKVIAVSKAEPECCIDHSLRLHIAQSAVCATADWRSDRRQNATEQSSLREGM